MDRYQQAIDALEDACCSNPLEHVFHFAYIIARLKTEQKITEMVLQIKNEPMSEPQFLQEILHDLGAGDAKITYEGYLEGFYREAVSEIQQEMSKYPSCGLLFDFGEVGE